MHFRLERPAAGSLTIRCRLFARYAELAGESEVTLELPHPSTVADAVGLLRARLPRGSEIPERPVVALNLSQVGETTPLADGDEVALLPPIAGGLPSILTPDRLDPAVMLAELSDGTMGGTALFIGTVRAGPDDGSVVAIEYSSYREMAEAEGARILAESAERWPAVRVALRHRVGRVELGEASVVVAAAAPHRTEAFAACREVVEAVKQRLPVWKKELYRDGQATWRGNDGSRASAAHTRD